MSNDYLKIFKHFGYTTQLKKLNEETYEFIEAVYDFEHNKNDCEEDVYLIKKSAIMYELADIMVLLKQFMNNYKISEKELNKVIDYKYNRTINRIETNYYDKKEQ